MSEPSYSLPDYLGRPIDHILSKIMPFKGGFFIEAGANDGINQSNTKYFEDRMGWEGILIEPTPSLYTDLVKNRPKSRCFSCALGSHSENGTYLNGDFDGHLMSSFTGRLSRPNTVVVPVRSLQSILDECAVSRVNLFSLDTEGYELNILKGIDFSKVWIEYMFIEVYNSQYKELVSFLDSVGYDMIACISNYNKATNPTWDGTHNDYLFKKR